DDWKIALGLALLCVLTRAMAIPASFWEWDDMNFARALTRYDLVAHNPHPPGFPVFIALAKVVFAVLGDEHRSLVGVNFIFAVLLGPALFYFFREIFHDRRVAFAGAMLGCFAPNVWVYSGAARSDGPAFTLGVIGLTLVLRGLHSRRALWIGCAVFGLAMGVRVTLLPVMGPMLAVVLLAWLRRRQWRVVLIALAIGTAAVLAWFVPFIWKTTWGVYAWVIGQHAQAGASSDTLFSPSENSVATYRLRRFFLDIWAAPWIRWTMLSLSASGLLALLVWQRWRALGLLALATVPLMVFAFIYNNPMGAFLYALPYMPLFAGLAAGGLVLWPRALFAKRLPKAQNIGVVLAVGLAVAMAEWSYPMVKLLHREASPPVRAYQYLRQTLDPKRDMLIYDGMFSSHQKFFMPDAKAFVSTEEMIPETNFIDLMTWQPRVVGLTIYPPMGVGGRHFEWSNERARRRLRTLSLGRLFDAYISDLTKTRGVRFLAGWYDEEEGGGNAWRWMGRRGQVALLGGAETMNLRVRGLTVPPPGSTRRATLVLRLDGVEVDRFTPADLEFDHTVALKPDPARLWSVLEIETDQTVIPRRDANIPDDRELGLRCSAIEWWAAPGAAATLRSNDQFLGEGWFGIERNRTDLWRWTRSEAIVKLPPVAADARLDLQMIVLEGANGRRSDVTVEVAGQVIERFQPPDGWFNKSYTVPMAMHRGAAVTLKLLAQPINNRLDQRPLALQVYYISWMPAGAH
ncbi:MAG: glycosyltransferase family 39 protein, partial [Blastocatellia bacterium]